MELRRLLVAVNGNRIDDEAISLACSLAKPRKAKVYGIYVIQVGRTLPLSAQIKPELEKGERLLTRAEEVAESLDYEIETDVLQARDVGAAIVDEAAERDVDLVVLGLDYKRRFGDFDLGQAVPYVLKNAPCRVLVLRETIG
ncbi:MAG: universal stress protein [Chloroflexi bacterium]|nr:universal stress protein [Chloroflexota bacterium]